jgi:hypothetical protein
VTTPGLSSPTFNERRVTSRVLVQDGQIVGLVGLIEDNVTKANGSAPWFKDILILSFSVSQQNNHRTKTELLVLITPHVLHDKRDARAFTEDLREQLPSAAAVPDESTNLPATGSPDPTLNLRRTAVAMRTIPGTARQRGFALLIVLWSMALMALIGTRITAAGHAEAQLATNLRANAIAEAAADGAVFEAVFHFMDGSAGHWPANGLAHRVAMPQAQVAVTLVGESSKISLNNAPPPLLLGLLQAVGVNRELAAVLTEQIVDWRSRSLRPHIPGAAGLQYKAAGRDWGPPNQPFRTVNELGMVLSMTPQILDRLRPYLSPYTYSTPNPDVAPPLIRAVLAEAEAGGVATLGFDVEPTLTITASAVSAGGGRFTRRAVIRLSSTAAANPNLPRFFVLKWDQATE